MNKGVTFKYDKQVWLVIGGRYTMVSIGASTLKVR